MLQLPTRLVTTLPALCYLSLFAMDYCSVFAQVSFIFLFCGTSGLPVLLSDWLIEKQYSE